MLKHNFSSLTNAETITALRDNSTACYQSVFSQYYGPLCAFSSQYVRKEDAEEIVQDTMLWLWENRLSLIPELKLKSLLFTIVKNKSLDQVRHNQVKRKVFDQLQKKYEEEFSSPDFYLYNELLIKYKKALEQLPKEYRESFYLNRNKGLTHKEIATQLNVSPQLVNYRIGKALKLLREELKEDLPLILLIYSIK